MISLIKYKHSLILVTMVLFSSFFSQCQDTTKIKVGDKVPEFELLDDQDIVFQVTKYIGNDNLIVYFYPKDDTPGCTKEACKFRDDYSEFTELDAKIIGISADTPESHRKFKTKYDLPFTLLSDPENKVREAFGIKADLFGMIPGRVTFIIDKEGIVRYIYDSQTNATKHVDEALRILKEIN